MQTDPQSPSQLDPFFHEGGEPNHDPTWITVFGFTSSATAFILKQFRQYGVILQTVMNQEGGNWIHIQYKTKIQARKALSKNGKVIFGIERNSDIYRVFTYVSHVFETIFKQTVCLRITYALDFWCGKKVEVRSVAICWYAPYGTGRVVVVKNWV